MLKVRSRSARFWTRWRFSIPRCVALYATTSQRSAGHLCDFSPASRICPTNRRMLLCLTLWHRERSPFSWLAPLPEANIYDLEVTSLGRTNHERSDDSVSAHGRRDESTEASNRGDRNR